MIIVFLKVNYNLLQLLKYYFSKIDVGFEIYICHFLFTSTNQTNNITKYL